jgi:hypothetical protein
MLNLVYRGWQPAACPQAEPGRHLIAMLLDPWKRV